MKIRFIEKYDPINNVYSWWTEKKGWLFWHMISESFSSTKATAEAFFNRISKHGINTKTEILLESDV